MKKQNHSNEKDSIDEVNKSESILFAKNQPLPEKKTNANLVEKTEKLFDNQDKSTSISKKPVKPPKLEDKPFEEFICMHLIPGLKSAIEEKGTSVTDIKLIEGKRPVVGGNCWIVFCELSEQRKFWLCFNKPVITSDKTILLSESNSAPGIVESFLIDEKKTTLPLIISRVLQRLNGQKWVGAN